MFFVAVAAILVFLVIVPIGLLIYASFVETLGVGSDVYTLDNYIRAIASPFTYSTFVSSVIFAVGASTLALVLGTIVAWILERTNVPFRSIFIGIVLVPLVLPGILETIAWVFLLSPKFGYLNAAIQGLFGLESAPVNVFTLPGMIWIQGTSNVPLVVLLMTAAFRSMDPSLEESASMSGAGTGQVVRRVSLPLMLPAFASVLLLVVVRGLEAVEVPALVGIPSRIYVFTSEIFLAFGDTPPDYGLGSALAVALFVFTIIGVWLYLRTTRRSERYQTVTGKAFRPRKMDLGKGRWLALGFMILYFLVVVAAPIGVIVWASFLPFFGPPSADMLARASLVNYEQLFADTGFHSALRNSIMLAIGAATGTVLLTSVISWIVYRSKIRGAKILDFLAFLPIAIPGIVLGMALITQYITLPIPIYGTLWVLLIAYVTKYIPYGMRSTSGAMLQIHRELEEAGATSGASSFQTFRRILVPLLVPGLAAGWIYICIVSFREFSTSVLLAGPDSRVLSVLLYYMYEQGQSTLVAAAGVVMITVLMITVAVFYKISGRFGISA